MHSDALKQAFFKGFETGRKVLCHYGREDLDARAEKAYQEYLKELNESEKHECNAVYCPSCWTHY